MKSDRIDRAKAETQALKALGVISRFEIDGHRAYPSVGTNRNFKDCLTAFAQYIKDNRLGDLRHATPALVNQYLSSRADQLSQKSLDMHRQAAQAYLIAKGDIKPTERLEIVKSKVETTLEHRAYTPDQVKMVADCQTERNRLSTELAYSAGLRAHELLTIRPLAEQPADIRKYEDGSTKSLETKWQGREAGVAYSVIGKGGLIREVRIPVALAKRLEATRRESPVTVWDRNVKYTSYYDVAGGQAWSSSFSRASERALGWSTGGHGLRHSYAQERLSELQKTVPYERALETVSQEMGHFRAEITTTYLR